MTKLTVIDMHTGGEPLRIVTGGYPDLPKGTILEKRAHVRDTLDYLRKILIFEPRGHYDMYGALLVEPDLPGADLAVLFMHNEGYSTMCGHAIIALGRYAVDKGLVAATEPVTRIGIEAPCGLVVADVAVKNGNPEMSVSKACLRSCLPVICRSTCPASAGFPMTLPMAVLSMHWLIAPNSASNLAATCPQFH